MARHEGQLSRPPRSAARGLGGGFDSIVTITFEPHGNNETLMTIEHAQLPPAWRDDHERGWTKIAGQLDTALRRLAAATAD